MLDSYWMCGVKVGILVRVQNLLEDQCAAVASTAASCFLLWKYLACNVHLAPLALMPCKAFSGRLLGQYQTFIGSVFISLKEPD